MPKTSKKVTSADAIAEMAFRGEDVSRYFTNTFTVVRPIRRVNVDLTEGMLRELDARAPLEHQPPDGHQDTARECVEGHTKALIGDDPRGTRELTNSKRSSGRGLAILK
jgi:hypothetical protein